MLFTSISFFILFVIVYLTFDRDLVLRYAFKASSSVPTALSITQSATTFLSSSWPLWISTVSLSAFIVFRRSILNKTSEIALLLLVFITFPLAIYTFTKAGADVNHFVLPLYLLLMVNICLLCKITISSSIQNYTKLVILFIGFIFATPFSISYLKTNCGWYLWIKNPHEIAFRFLKQHPEESIYFPWQPLSSLLANGSMYHLDQGLLFEKINNVGQRSESNLTNYLPKKPFKIAVRPFGAASFVSESKESEKLVSIDFPDLKEWKITIVE